MDMANYVFGSAVHKNSQLSYKRRRPLDPNRAKRRIVEAETVLSRHRRITDVHMTRREPPSCSHEGT